MFDNSQITHIVTETILLIKLTKQFEINNASYTEEVRSAAALRLSLKKKYVEMLMAPITETDLNAFNEEFKRQDPELFSDLTKNQEKPAEKK